MIGPDQTTVVGSKEVLITLREKKLSSLIMSTFELSQGDPDLQSNIMEFLVFNNPEYRMSSDEEQVVEARVKKLIMGRVEISSEDPNSHTRIPYYSIDAQLKKPLRIMTGNRSLDSVLSAEQRVEANSLLIKKITTGIIARDHHFLVDYYQQGGRPRGRKFSLDSKLSPWRSHLKSYAFDRETTGVSELDEMFRGVRLLVREKIKSSDWNENPTKEDLERYENEGLTKPVKELFLLARVWEEKHGKPFF